MRPANLFYFYRRRLRHRLVQELLALAGIAVGVALLFAVEVSNESLSQSVVEYAHGLLGRAQLELAARGANGMPESLIPQVQRVPGVAAVAPALDVQVNVVGPRGERSVTMLAADSRLAHMGGRLLESFVTDRLVHTRALVLPADVADAVGVRFGGTVTLEIDGRHSLAAVGNVLDEHDVGGLAKSPIAVVPLEYGQALARMPAQISRLYVIAEPGRQRAVEAALRRLVAGRINVRPADADRRIYEEAAVPMDRSTSLFAGISALVGFLFAFNAMLLMARERRRVIVELRMCGFRMAAVFQVLLFDGLVLGVAAALVGLGLGDLLSAWVLDPQPGYLGIAFPVGTARDLSVKAAALAVSGGIVATLLATLAPLGSAFSNRPIDSTADDRLDPASSARPLRSGRLVIAALFCIGLTTAIFVALPELAILGMASLLAGMVLCLPAALTATLGVVLRLRRRLRSAIPTIAVGELRSSGTRTVALCGIAAIAVFGSTAIEGAHRDLLRGLDGAAHDIPAGADVWVALRADSNHLSTTPFSPGIARRLRDIPGVAAVLPYRGSFLDIGTRRVWIVAPARDAPDPVPASQLVEGNLARANARLHAEGWAVLSESLADQFGVGLGGRFTLPSPRPRTFRLAGVTSNLGWAPGSIVLNADDYRSAWGNPDVSALEIELSSVSAEAGKRRVEHYLGRGSPFLVETRTERQQRFSAKAREGLSRLTQIASLVLLAAALAIAAAMGGMIWERRVRLAQLKLVGIHPKRLWQALLVETLLLLSVGCGLGAIFGIYGQQLLDRALATVTGFPVVDSLGLTVAAVSLLVVTITAMVIAALPGYLAARVPANIAFQE